MSLIAFRILDGRRRKLPISPKENTVCLRGVIKTDTHHTFPLQTGHKKDRIFLFVVLRRRKTSGK